MGRVSCSDNKQTPYYRQARICLKHTSIDPLPCVIAQSARIVPRPRPWVKILSASEENTQDTLHNYISQGLGSGTASAVPVLQDLMFLFRKNFWSSKLYSVTS